MHQLGESGTVTDMGKMEKLMDVVRTDIVLSQGWGRNSSAASARSPGAPT